MNDIVFSKAGKSYSASALKSLSYNAYNAIVTYEKQAARGLNPPIEDLAKAVRTCFRAYGMNGWNDIATVVLMLQRVVCFTESGGKKKWKIIGITRFRDVMAKWNDEINEVESDEEANVVSTTIVRISSAERNDRIDNIRYMVDTLTNIYNKPYNEERAKEEAVAYAQLEQCVKELFCDTYAIPSEYIPYIAHRCLFETAGFIENKFQVCGAADFRKWILNDMLVGYFGVDLSVHSKVKEKQVKKKREMIGIEFNEQIIEDEKNEGVMSAKEFSQRSFDAYIQYVRLIKGEITVEEAVKEMAPFMAMYDFELTPQNIINIITVRMTSYEKENGEWVQKVKPISEFRSFIKAGWREEASVRVQTAEVCPLCHARTIANRINLPVYDEEGRYVGCYICNVVTCNESGEHYVCEEELSSFFERLYKRIGSAIRQYHVKAGGGIRYRIRDDGYLNADVSKLNFRIEKVSEPREQHEREGEQLELNPQSFLSKMGYSISKHTNERQHILREAVSAYGKRRILDHIEFLIRMRRNQQNRDYSEAIEIWEEDIEYVIQDI